MCRSSEGERKAGDWKIYLLAGDDMEKKEEKTTLLIGNYWNTNAT